MFSRGPSPRTWGKQRNKVEGEMTKRTIPTGVGKTALRPANAGTFTDHPHGRGENRYLRPFEHDDIGPSPRAWGKQMP